MYNKNLQPFAEKNNKYCIALTKDIKSAINKTTRQYKWGKFDINSFATADSQPLIQTHIFVFKKKYVL